MLPAPLPGRRGLADLDPAALAEEVLGCWDDLLDLVTAPSTDLSRPSRLPGWSGRDVLVHLGGWDDAVPMEGVLASARARDTTSTVDPDAVNAELVARHRGASDDEVLQALVRARDAVADFLEGDEAAVLGRAPSRSTLGPLPVLTLVHAATYELAVHGLDLAPCGAPPPSARLLDRGLAALIDVTAALAARAGVHQRTTAMTPGGGWAFTTAPDGWTTERVPAGPFEGAGVRGSAADLLDASAGRAAVPGLLLSRRLVVTDLAAWMRLAPLVSELPGLPGGAALRGVAGSVGRLGRFFSR